MYEAGHVSELLDPEYSLLQRSFLFRPLLACPAVTIRDTQALMGKAMLDEDSRTVRLQQQPAYLV